MPGRHGAAGPDPARLCEWRVSIVEVAARRGQGLDFAARVNAALALDPPAAGQARVGAAASLLWIAPEAWLVVAPPEPPGALALRLASAVGPSAAVMDQSSGLSALRLSGVRARQVLAKGCRIDLHPRAFRTDQVARTIIAQVPIILHQADELPSYTLLVPRMLAISFVEFLLEASAEFGCEIGPPL
ncbi:sarcosine oxidase subunit gamma [Rhizobiales bacterium GAS191]|nr:sarcosine oxidase subunit gamma [Rhizobiales bacterium GAS191]